jgi:anion-transporting  ArsA/GET3 family ATPase
VLDRRLQLVVGKGGVGKSTVTAALAIAQARKGLRVLAMELGRPGGLAAIFGVTPAQPGVPVEACPGLWVAHVEGEAALAEYLELVVPIRRVLAAVFTSRIYRFFVAAAPGLKELMTVGKIWYEQDRKDADGRPVWDRVIVDAGASGHSLQYLQMPSTAAQTFRAGLVHREATRVEGLLRNPAVTAVHVVAIPEEMPVSEALEIIGRLSGDLQLPLGRVFLNRCRAAVPSDAFALTARLRAATAPCDLAIHGVTGERLLEGLLTAAERALAWDPVQRSAIERLRAAQDSSVVSLPLLVAEEFGAREVELLATRIAQEEGRS